MLSVTYMCHAFTLTKLHLSHLLSNGSSHVGGPRSLRSAHVISAAVTGGPYARSRVCQPEAWCGGGDLCQNGTWWSPVKQQSLADICNCDNSQL